MNLDQVGNGTFKPSIPAKFVENHDPFLVLLVRVGGILSVIGSIFIIVSYCFTYAFLDLVHSFIYVYIYIYIYV